MSKPTICGQIGLMLVIAVSILPAWWFGSVAARDVMWIFWASIAALICCQLPAVRELRFPALTIPLLLGALIGLLQLAPLSRGVHADASPTGAKLWASLVPANSPVGEGGETKLRDRVGLAPVAAAFPISLYPASTRRDLSMLLLATAVFVAGSQLIATPIAQCIYCGAIALNGASLAFFGLAQQLSWNGKLYWRVPFEAGTPFASFVNRNNAAGFLNLCLAGAIGLCVWAVSRTAVSNRGDNYPSKPEDRWRLAGNQLVRFVASLDAITLTAFTSSIVIMAGILCSLSRGGWISLTVGAMVTLMAALVSQRGGRPRLSWLAVAALAGLLLVGWLGKSEVVQQRLSTLLDYRQTLTDRRLPHWQDGFHAARDFWRAGSGLGTYRYVYSLYQERSDDAWYYHAENQYLESLVDAGVPGLLLLLTAIGLMGLVCWRLLREPPHRTSYALGIAATFALASQSVHAVFDFGLYIPANMVLFGLLCGAAAGQAVRLEADRDGRLKPTWTAWISRLIILPPAPASREHSSHSWLVPSSWLPSRCGKSPLWRPLSAQRNLFLPVKWT